MKKRSEDEVGRAEQVARYADVILAAGLEISETADLFDLIILAGNIEHDPAVKARKPIFTTKDELLALLRGLPRKEREALCERIKRRHSRGLVG